MRDVKRWILVLMFFLVAGSGVTAGGDDEKPEPEHDIFGGPPLCC